MKKLYIDCSMGASGDMLSAALCALLPEPDAFISEMNGLGIPGVKVKLDEKSQYGVSGLHFSVTVNGTEEGDEGITEVIPDNVHEHTHLHGDHTHEHTHEHSHEPAHVHHHAHTHSDLKTIKEIIAAMPLPDKVRQDVNEVYGLIAAAESKVHGEKTELIHFHEVGAMDAVADITAVCLAMYKLGIEDFAVSPVNVGSGTVKCAHGILPVPAPAAAELLKGISCYGSEIKGELCTPTGAALIKKYASSVGPMPCMSVEKTGIGIGTKDFGRCNCLRTFFGQTAGFEGERAVELSCNIDDMDGEMLGFSMDRLLACGAADVFFTPIYMKKNRPAYMLTCICSEENCNEVTKAIFKYTTTLGVRKKPLERSVLERSIRVIETSLGPVRVKSSEGFGVVRSKPEYDDIREIAEKHGLSCLEVLKRLEGEL